MYDGITSAWADLLGGSLTVVSTASVIYDDDVILDDLPIESGRITKSSDGRQIQQKLTLTTADDTGFLLASPGSPLMPFGQQIVIRSGLADKADDPVYAEYIPMGIFGIDAPDVAGDVAPWRLYPNGTWLVTGGKVTANCSDPLAQIARENFPAPQRPPTGATVRSETERLLADRLPTPDWPGWVTDLDVPTSVVYDSSRLTTLLDLARMVSGVAWVDRDGGYNLLSPQRAETGVWTLAVADPSDPHDAGALVTWTPAMSRDAVFNAVVITSEDYTGYPIRGVVTETDGPFRWGGPLGEVPLVEEDRLQKTNRACQAAAETRYQQMLDERSITVHVTCLPNLAVDPLDTIALELPGKSILGLVTAVDYPLTAGVMEMDVSIPLQSWLAEPVYSQGIEPKWLRPRFYGGYGSGY